MSKRRFVCGVALAICLAGCSGTSQNQESTTNPSPVDNARPQADTFLLGADLSYVNEMLDCGAHYQFDGEVMDPYQLFAQAGNDLVRVRLWHDPDWTDYSTFDDVARTIGEAHKHNMQVLLDFHYSDTWADPHKQFIPAAWEHLHGDTEALGDALYQYTYDTLLNLFHQQRLPEYVQIGNEINAEILQRESDMQEAPINWSRNATLLNQGLKAVDDFNTTYQTRIKTLLHIAQPENALVWFPAAREAGVNAFDIIGLSYYGKWSEYKLDNLGGAIAQLITENQKDVMVVETAYPWGFVDVDNASNILGPDSLLEGYPATPAGQLRYLQDLSQIVRSAGGMGVIYWEPAWISSACDTLWGQGSHWENATFFDAANDNEALPALQFYQTE